MTGRKIMLLYWGRRGINTLVGEIVAALDRHCGPPCLLSLSRANTDLPAFTQLGERLVLVDTFSSNLGAICLWRIPVLRARLAQVIQDTGVSDVITLMPHIWSFLVSGAVTAAGANYHTILHDAEPHPGDGTARMLPLLLKDMRAATTVFTLSDAVAEMALSLNLIRPSQLARLFHPLTGSKFTATQMAPSAGQPWRLLFLGRIMPYKGLPLLLEAFRQLKAEGRDVTLSVMGEGPLDDVADRIAALKVEVTNRWLGDDEIAAALSSHHAVVLSHIEASQSGVVASALGAGVPVVATPVGGLAEQVRDGVTGLVAASVSATALADALRALMDTPGLHGRLASNVVAERQAKSPDAFIAALLAALERPRDG